MEKVEEAKIRLAFLKENFEYQDYFFQFLEWDKERPKGNGAWPGLGFNKFGLTGLRFYLSSPSYKYEAILNLINPQKDLNALPQQYINLLPQLFHEPSITAIEINNIPSPLEVPSDGGQIQPFRVIKERGLNYWERLFKVDLSRKKVLILKEFEKYIEAAFKHNKQNSKRNREEAWTHLTVWNRRREKKSFQTIARELKLNVDTAKKSFYRAYELTQNKKYDPAFLKAEIWRVKKTDIKKTCDTCPGKKTCDTLCPDVLRYIDQDSINLREKLLDHEPITEKVLPKKSKNIVKEKNTQKLKEVIVCQYCNTVIQETTEFNRCPFCNKKYNLIL